MIDDNYVLTGGKFKGLTVREIRVKHPWYYKWAQENAPNLLKKFEPTPKAAPPRKEIALNEDGEEIDSTEIGWNKNQAMKNMSQEDLWNSFLADRKK